MKGPWKILISLFSLLFVVIFAIQNTANVTVNLFLTKITVPIVMVILITLIIGVIIGLLVSFTSVSRARRNTKRIEQELSDLKRQQTTNVQAKESKLVN